MRAEPPSVTTPVGLAPYALGGAALTATIVVAAGAVGPPQFARPFTTWGGLLAPFGVWPDHDRLPGIALGLSMAGLVIVWLLLARAVHRSPVPPRSLWMVGTGWLAPLVVGPPILSNDVFSYVAQGAVAARGADPTRTSSFALGWASPLTQAVDPIWRDTPSPYGPLATLLQRAMVEATAPQPVLAVVGLRLLTLGSVLAATVLAVSIVRALPVDRTEDRSRREAFVVLLIWVDPLVSLHVVGAIHLEGVLAVLVLAAVRLVMVRTPAADFGAVVAAVGAAAVKLPVGGIVVLVIGAVVLGRAVATVDRLRWAVAATVVAAATYAALCAVAGSGWNVLAVITTPAAGRTPAAPATLLAYLASPVRWLGAAGAGSLEDATRLLCSALALAAIGWLVATASRRPPVATAGLALFALAAGSPVVYPWYLAWSVPLLAVVAVGAWRRRLVIGAAAGALMTVQGLTRLETIGFATTVITALLVLVWITEHDLRARALRAARVRLDGPIPRRMGTVRE